MTNKTHSEDNGPRIVMRPEEPQDTKPKRKPIRWAPVAEQLREHPGKWFLVAENVSVSLPGHLRTAHGLDARIEGTDPSGRRAERLYARWPLDGEEV